MVKRFAVWTDRRSVGDDVAGVVNTQTFIAAPAVEGAAGGLAVLVSTRGATFTICAEAEKDAAKIKKLENKMRQRILLNFP